MGRKSGLSKYYGVRVGRTPGVYDWWEKCREQTDGFPGAVFKSFPTREAAAEWVAAAAPPPPPPPPPTASAASALSCSLYGNMASSGGEKGKEKEKYYAVAVGRDPGIYTDYADALASHSGFRGALHQRFDTCAGAEEWLRLHRSSSRDGGVGVSDASASPGSEGGVGENEKKEIREEEEEEEDDSNSEASWDDSLDTSRVDAVTPTPRSFMLSVYSEYTQRERRAQEALLGDHNNNDNNNHQLPSSAQSARQPLLLQLQPPSLSSGQLLQPQPPSAPTPPSSYFDQFQDFKPDVSASFDDEFARCMSSQDIAPRTAEYRRLRTRAIAQELKFHYSQPPPPPASAAAAPQNSDEEPSLTQIKQEEPSLTQVKQEEPSLTQIKQEEPSLLMMYQNLCRATRLPVFETEKECTGALSEVLVNIVDYIDAARAGEPHVKVWDDFAAFCDYTLGGDGEKCINRAEAKAIDGGFLAVLLRKVTGGASFRWPGRGGKRKRQREREREAEGASAVKRVRVVSKRSR